MSQKSSQVETLLSDPNVKLWQVLELTDLENDVKSRSKKLFDL